MNMSFTINNISSSSVTYQGHTITAGTSYTPPTGSQKDFASDPGLVADALANVITITIGNNTWAGEIAKTVLNAASYSVVQLQGGTDETAIGNTSDRLKVEATQSGTWTISTGGAFSANIFKQNEYTLTTRSETDIPSTTYTVASGKTFFLTNFTASYDAQSTLYVRLKKQTGGSGSFNTVVRMTLEVGGQGTGTTPIDFSTPISIGSAGDVFKLTAECSVVKGAVWGSFSGIES